MNHWPGNYDGIVQMPRLGTSGPAGGGSGSSVADVLSPPIPSCPILSSTIASTAANNSVTVVVGANSATTRRMIVADYNNNILNFIDTSLGTLVAHITPPRSLAGQFQSTFDSSRSRFVVPGDSVNGFMAYSGDGVLQLSVDFASRCGIAYSVSQDKIYGAFSGSPTHILTIDPATLTQITDTPTVLGAFNKPFCTGNYLIGHGSAWHVFSLPSLTYLGDIAAPATVGFNGSIAVNPANGHVFFIGNDNVSIYEADLSTLAVVNTYTAPWGISWMVYDPIRFKFVFVGNRFAEMDPSTGVFTCDTDVEDILGGFQPEVDAVTGALYIPLDGQIVPNPLVNIYT